MFIDPADEPTCIGSVKWAPPDGRDSVLLSVIVGPGRFNAGRNFNNPEIFDLVYTHKFSARLTYSFETPVRLPDARAGHRHGPLVRRAQLPDVHLHAAR